MPQLCCNTFCAFFLVLTFFRVTLYTMCTRISSSGGRHYLQMVAGYRDLQEKVKIKLLANLGRLDRLPTEKLDPLIKGLNRAVECLENTAHELLHAPSRTYGTVFVLHELWQDIGFDHALKQTLRSNRRSIDVEARVRAMVRNRLCNPSSKLGYLRWLETIAMPAIPPQTITHQHLLRAMDTLMDNSGAVEKAIARQIRPPC